MRTQRRVSCRDLGQGDCEGWLWKKKTDAGLGSGSSPAALSSKWSKRWVVIKGTAIYCFRSNEVDDERRAECYIRLPGYQVMPAFECKRKFAFRIGHPKRKTFFFAAERQMDMSRWMNKMGLAAIEYQYEGQDQEDDDTNAVNETKTSKAADDYVSESDNDDDHTDTSSTTKEQTTTETNNHKKQQSEDGQSPRKTKKHVRKKSQSLDNLIDDSVPPRSGSLTTSMMAKSSELLANEHRSASVGGDKDLEKMKRSAAKRVQSQSSGGSGGMLSSLLNGRLRSKPTSANTSPSRQHRTKNKLERRSSPGGIGGGESSSGHRSAPGTPPTDGKYRLSYDSSMASTSASTSGRNSTTSLASSSRRDTLGRPQGSGSYTHIDSELARECSSMAVVDENTATENSETMQASVQDLCKAIKNAEVDINGIDRRTSLRRKMTLLSRDPNKNEKMLKKRALERELKAKEQELEYYNKLLSDGVEAVTHERLHQWINQHLSLVADIGTIRDMARKHQRKTVSGADFVEPAEVATTSRNRNNNNSSSSSLRRPRSCAITTDIDQLVGAGDDHPISIRVSPKIRLASSRRSYYLETDL